MNSKGAIVTPGVTVVEIVPENEKLIIEAKLPLSEIGYVKKDLEAKIRLNTPEGSRFQSIKGKVGVRWSRQNFKSKRGGVLSCES